ncbi:hypothetical protein EVAR_86712_1 [Eumeta japonica]|uniref:Uncharacterized protein n=1 Tax=Eumeta variegata TaxID=151549 RepID=A0A4C1ZGC0_EUMVA|nr:hypothetical protein EVAR_86712_1 [Eumeta japonica]
MWQRCAVSMATLHVTTKGMYAFMDSVRSKCFATKRLRNFIVPITTLQKNRLQAYIQDGRTKIWLTLDIDDVITINEVLEPTHSREVPVADRFAERSSP